MTTIEQILAWTIAASLVFNVLLLIYKQPRVDPTPERWGGHYRIGYAAFPGVYLILYPVHHWESGKVVDWKPLDTDPDNPNKRRAPTEFPTWEDAAREADKLARHRIHRDAEHDVVPL